MKTGKLLIGGFILVTVGIFSNQLINKKQTVSSKSSLEKSSILITTERSLPVYDGVERSSLYVPVRDGTKLAMNIYWPTQNGEKRTGKLPTIFVMTPYRARYRNEDGSISETGLSSRLGLSGLSKRGFVIAVADIRGKGASFGTRTGFQNRTEAQDGYDLVEWLADQEWSNGNVGMVGCSYLGGASLQVASTAPPSLKAVFAGATDFDKYAFVKRGGITAQFHTRPDETSNIDLASIPVDGDEDKSQLIEAVKEHTNNTPMAGLWRGMPYRDSISSYTKSQFWEEVSIYNYVDEIKASGIELYHWGNWEDEPSAQTLILAKNLGGKLLLGPGSHCVPPPNFDLGAELGKFFDQTLNGVETDIDDEPLYRYWVNGAPKGAEWKVSNTLPGQENVEQIWALSGDKTLQNPQDQTQAIPKSMDSFEVDYNVETGAYFSFWVESLAEKGMAYASATLEKDTTFLGSPIADLNISISRKNTDVTDGLVFVYLEDVAPDGEARVVSFGRLAASHRRLSPAPYDNLDLPWHSGRKDDMLPVRTDEVMAMKIDMTPISEIIKAGHSLRFVVTGADPRQRNLAEIKQSPSPIIAVHIGGENPSRLHLKINATDQ